MMINNYTKWLNEAELVQLTEQQFMENACVGAKKINDKIDAKRCWLWKRRGSPLWTNYLKEGGEILWKLGNVDEVVYSNVSYEHGSYDGLITETSIKNFPDKIGFMHCLCDELPNFKEIQTLFLDDTKIEKIDESTVVSNLFLTRCHHGHKAPYDFSKMKVKAFGSFPYPHDGGDLWFDIIPKADFYFFHDLYGHILFKPTITTEKKDIPIELQPFWNKKMSLTNDRATPFAPLSETIIYRDKDIENLSGCIEISRLFKEDAPKYIKAFIESGKSFSDFSRDIRGHILSRKLGI